MFITSKKYLMTFDRCAKPCFLWEMKCKKKKKEKINIHAQGNFSTANARHHCLITYHLLTSALIHVSIIFFSL
jgi:hypothetical protein